MRRSSWVLCLAILMGAVLCGDVLPIGPGAWAQEPPDLSVAEASGTAPVEPAPSESETAEPEEPIQLGSARQTMRTFIRAMEAKDYRTAVTTMDFSALDPAPDDFEQLGYAQRLKVVVEKLALITPADISDDPDGPPFRYPPGETTQPVVVARGDDGAWRFTAETVEKIGELYALYKAQALDRPAEAPEEKPGEPEEKADETEAEDAPEPPQPKVPEGLRSARRTMRTLFDSFEQKDYQSALATLDFSEMEAANPEMGPLAKLGYARRLKEIIERMARIDYGEISDDPDGPDYFFPPEEANQPIAITRGETGTWRFSTDTVARIDALHPLFIDKPVLNLPEEQRPWYDRELVLGNEVWRILALFAAVFVSLVVGQLLRTVLKWWAAVLERRGRALGAVVFKTLAKTAVGILFLLGLTAGVRALVLEHEVESLASTIIRVVFALVVGYVCFRLVDVAVEMLRGLAKKTGSTLNDMLVPIVSTSLRLTIIVLVVLEIATAVSDQPPSTVIAGLGAGGLAIGLAAQDTIKNFFGSVMIFADRPFELGDRIVIDGHDGPVESVGFRSTRIRTLEGHLVTVPNGEIAHKTIHNIGKRPYIRRIMNVRVAYDTPPEKVRRALEILRELLDNHEGMKEEFPPRVFLHDFLDTAINIRAIYWFHPPAYWDFCDYGERLNLQIVERFRAEGIRFALPSQRLFLAGDPERPLGRDGEPTLE